MREDARSLVDLTDSDFLQLIEIAKKSWDSDKVFDRLRKEVSSLSRSGNDRHKAVFIEATLATICQDVPFSLPEPSQDFSTSPHKVVSKATYRVEEPKKADVTGPNNEKTGPTIEEFLGVLKVMHRMALKDKIVCMQGGVVKVNNLSLCQRLLPQIKQAFVSLGYPNLEVKLEDADA